MWCRQTQGSEHPAASSQAHTLSKTRREPSKHTARLSGWPPRPPTWPGGNARVPGKNSTLGGETNRKGGKQARPMIGHNSLRKIGSASQMLHNQAAPDKQWEGLSSLLTTPGKVESSTGWGVHAAPPTSHVLVEEVGSWVA